MRLNFGDEYYKIFAIKESTLCTGFMQFKTHSDKKSIQRRRSKDNKTKVDKNSSITNSYRPKKRNSQSNKSKVEHNEPTKVVLFNKPFDVLTQFTDQQGRQTLKDFIPIEKVYPAGRLDRDSEGLLVLTNDGKLQDKIASPKHKMAKIYWVQVEKIPTEESLEQLRNGVELKDGMTKPAKVKIIDEPANLWPRVPPIRERKAIPTCWLEIEIKEGRNRQVRRMTAHIGHPTLRLIRYRVGNWTIDGLDNGSYQVLEK